MKIAFASCMHAGLFPQQPVWEWIASHNPDHLVLLGDSIYLDVSAGPLHPKDLPDVEFARRLLRLYTAQINQPAFKALVHGMPNNRVWSIWDDHDFLWNDACGGDIALNPVHHEKIRLSTAFQEAFRGALASSLAADSFPTAYDAPVFWDQNQPPMTVPSVPLGDDVWLHLTDGRTHRTRTWLLQESQRSLLGDEQMAQLTAAIAAAPDDALHLLASGSTTATYKTHYARDWQWLKQHAATHRMLVLSGDIHRNETDAFFTGGLPLHEATSSAAAVKDAVFIGKTRRNFGLLDIDGDTVGVKLYANGSAQKTLTRTLSRTTWLPVP